MFCVAKHLSSWLMLGQGTGLCVFIQANVGSLKVIWDGYTKPNWASIAAPLSFWTNSLAIDIYAVLSSYPPSVLKAN